MGGKDKSFPLHKVFLILLIGLVSFAQENYNQEERQLFQKFKSLDKSYKKAVMYYTEGNLKKAKREFEKVLEIMPKHADACFYMSQIIYKEGDLKTAEDFIHKAKKNYSVIAKMKVRMAEADMLKLQEQREARQKKLEELEEELASVSASTKDSEAEKTRIESEIERVKQDIERIDNSQKKPIPSGEEPPGDYYYFHGNIYYKMKKFREAHDQYVEAIRIDPKQGKAYNNLATLYFQVKQYEKALEAIKQAEKNGAEVNPEFKKVILKALGKNGP